MLVKYRLPARFEKTALDLAILGVAYCLAFLIRFEGRLAPEAIDALVGSLPYVLFLKLLCLVALKIPRLTWRYVSLLEAQCLFLALSAASGILIGVRLMAELNPGIASSSRYASIPASVLATDFLLSVFGTLLLRAGVRCWGQWYRRHRLMRSGQLNVPTVFIGAGEAGALVAKEVTARPDLGIQPVGFLDDSPAKRGMIVHGLRVLGTTADLERVVKDYEAAQALITIGHLSAPDTRRIVELCRRCDIPAKVIPGIQDMVAGRVNLSAMREVAIEDLLRRDPVQLDNQAIAGIVRGRTILVSGAGGSIGSELCRKLCGFGPATLLLVEQAENGLFHIHRQLLTEFPQVTLVPCIADICDRNRVQQIFASWRPSVVFHAAAHKHVPLMEWNPGEAIKNNVIGTRQLADLADRFQVDRFVMISSDKAVNPTSIMGVSKRIAEIYIQALSQRSATRFVTVRFGNVLGSAGSVIPIFKEQIAKGGPVTVTHPEMKRYFMTIPEACQLILQAASMGRGGEVFILDMGEPVKIVDLARDLIRLSGLTSDEIEIRFTGLRPGEKLFEELSRKEESAQRTQHPKIFIGQLSAQDWAAVNRQVEELRRLAECAQARKILAKLKEIVPEYVCNGLAGVEPSNAIEPADAQAMAEPQTNEEAGEAAQEPEWDVDAAPVPAIS